LSSTFVGSASLPPGGVRRNREGKVGLPSPSRLSQAESGNDLEDKLSLMHPMESPAMAQLPKELAVDAPESAITEHDHDFAALGLSNDVRDNGINIGQIAGLLAG